MAFRARRQWVPVRAEHTLDSAPEHSLPPGNRRHLAVAGPAHDVSDSFVRHDLVEPIHDRVKEFFILMLVLETAMIGVFVALDLFLFYFFWEATLIPMALLIGMYGHERRVYAAVKFFLFTMVASVFMLAAIIWLYAKTGTFDFVTIQSADAERRGAGFATPRSGSFSASSSPSR